LSGNNYNQKDEIFTFGWELEDRNYEWMMKGINGENPKNFTKFFAKKI